MGGLGRDATSKLILADNATVTIGAASTGNILVGGTIALANTNPSQADKLIVAGNVKLHGTAAGIVFHDGTIQTTASQAQAFPTGDYGLLDTANVTIDAFNQVTGGRTDFDMLTDPSGSVVGQDLGAF